MYKKINKRACINNWACCWSSGLSSESVPCGEGARVAVGPDGALVKLAGADEGAEGAIWGIPPGNIGWGIFGMDTGTDVSTNLWLLIPNILKRKEN